MKYRHDSYRFYATTWLLSLDTSAVSLFTYMNAMCKRKNQQIDRMFFKLVRLNEINWLVGQWLWHSNYCLDKYGECNQVHVQ